VAAWQPYGLPRDATLAPMPMQRFATLCHASIISLIDMAYLVLRAATL
jgi:hypothetical protein